MNTGTRGMKNTVQEVRNETEKKTWNRKKETKERNRKRNKGTEGKQGNGVEKGTKEWNRERGKKNKGME